MKQDPSKIRFFRLLLGGLYLAAGSVFLLFALRGADYYLTPISQRAYHPEFRTLKPAGSLGLWFGVAGALMMTSLLLYSLRKRTKLFGGLFRLKYWLDVHIFMGIMGPLFILLHTSLKLNGLVAVSFWAMVAVAASGVFGRYLYIQIPRNLRGEALSSADLEAQIAELGQLPHGDELSPESRSELKRFLERESQSGGVVSIGAMIWSDLRRALRPRRLEKAVVARFGLSVEGARALLAAVDEKALLQRRANRLRKVQRMFHMWHVIHRPFALVMYLIMLIHIVVALLFGISWKAST